MKKNLLILLFFCPRITATAQSITFNDLTNLTNLSQSEAHAYLTLGKVFKHQYIEEINGRKIEHFRSISAKEKEQTITVGDETILPNRTVLRAVTYHTRDPQHVLVLIAQAKRGKLLLTFQGVDAKNNIYEFDNDFYHIKMSISTTEDKGLVQIDQKAYTPH